MENAPSYGKLDHTRCLRIIFFAFKKSKFSYVPVIYPALLWVIKRAGGKSTTGIRPRWHAFGGLMASAVMAGAVFFHLFTPLGIEVLHEGQSDGGSLFYAAVSILVLGIVLFLINISAAKQQSY